MDSEKCAPQNVETISVNNTVTENDSISRPENTGKEDCVADGPESTVTQKTNDESVTDQVSSEGTKQTKTSAVKLKVEAEEGSSTQERKPSAENESNKSVEQRVVRGASWDIYVLFARDLGPKDVKRVKAVLDTALGKGAHKIRPRVRGDTLLYIHFRSKEELVVGEKELRKRNIFTCRMHTCKDPKDQTKQPTTSKKRKTDNKDEGEDTDTDTEHPVSKKSKPKKLNSQFLEGSYEDQIAWKNRDLYFKLRKVAKILLGSSPKYEGLITQRQLIHKGLLCPVEEFKGCPDDERYVRRCIFSIDPDSETGKPAIFFKAGDGSMHLLSVINHNYPQHVVDVAMMFEKVMHASKVAADVGSDERFWVELIIRTNKAKELMLVVQLTAPQEVMLDRMLRVNKELKEFYQNGEGKDCHVVSVYTKVKDSVLLAMGSAHLEETVLDLKFELPPGMNFWNNMYAAEVVCKTIQEVLAPTKEVSIVEVGCGMGLIGMYLSKFAGEVLCVDEEHFVEEAKKNAALNNITGCQYFGGKPDEQVPIAVSKISLDEVAAIVIGNASSLCTRAKAMEGLRKIEKLKRVVLVTELYYPRFTPIQVLGKQSTANGLGNPFFIVKVIPVDFKPKAKGYLLLFVLERIALDSLPRMPGSAGERSVFQNNAPETQDEDEEYRKFKKNKNKKYLNTVSRRNKHLKQKYKSYVARQNAYMAQQNAYMAQQNAYMAQQTYGRWAHYN